MTHVQGGREHRASLLRERDGGDLASLRGGDTTQSTLFSLDRPGLTPPSIARYAAEATFLPGAVGDELIA